MPVGKYRYAVLGRTAATAILIRRGNAKRRDRARIVIGKLPRYIRLKRLVRRGTFEVLVLRLQILHFSRDEVIHEGATVGVVVVDDVACGVIDSVFDITGLCGHVVSNLCDSLAVLAATIGKLLLDGVKLLHECHLRVASCDLCGREAIGYSLCNVGEAVQHTGIHGVEAIADTVVYSVKLALKRGEVCSQHIIIGHTSGVTSPAVAAPPEHCKQE